MRTLIIVGMLLALASACSPTPTPSQLAEPTSALPASSPTTAPSAAPLTQPAPLVPSTTPLVAMPLTLEILSPQDGAVVNASQLVVSGRSSPGAVVTVNDDIQIAAPDGTFQDTLTLTEGLNLIEIIASDTSGNEASLELTVTYEP